MKTILSVMFAMIVGLTFVGSTFADEKKMDAPAGTTGAPAAEKKQGDATKKDADKAAADKKKKEAGDKETKH